MGFPPSVSSSIRWTIFGLFASLSAPLAVQGEAIPLELISDTPLVYDTDTGRLIADGPSEIRIRRWQLVAGSLSYVPLEGILELGEGIELVRIPDTDPASATGSSAEVLPAGRPLVRIEDHLADSGLRGTAETLSYDAGEGSAVLTGNPSVYSPKAILRAESARYQNNPESLQLESIRAGNGNFTADAALARIEDSSVTFEDASVRLREPSPVAPEIRGETVQLVDDELVEVENATFAVGPVPIFWLPKASFRPAIDGPLTFSARVGFNNTFGGSLEVIPTLRVNPNLALSPGFDIYTKRGLLLAPGIRWTGDNPDDDVRIESGWIRDQADVAPAFQGDPIPEDRYFFNLRAKRASSRSYHAIAQLTPWSDEEVIRDFREEWADRYTDPTNFTEAEWHRGNAYVLGYASYRTNDFQNLVADEPLVEIGWLPTPVGPLNTVVEARLRGERQVRRESLLPKEEAELAVVDLRAFQPLHRGGFSLRPIAGVRAYAIEQNTTAIRQADGFAAEFGFDASFRTTGVFAVESPLREIEGLRHELRPVFGFRYRPGLQEENLNPFVPDDLYISGVPSLSLLSDRRQISNLGETILRTGIENRLLTGSGDLTRELVRWNVYHEIEDELPVKAKRLQTVYNDLTLTPAPWLEFGNFINWNIDEGEIAEWSNRVLLRDAWKWDASIRTQFLDERIEQYFLTGNFRLNERNRVGTILRFDGLTEKLTEQRYLWEHQLGRTWLITTTFTVSDGDRRRSDFLFRVKFSVLGM